MAGPAPQSKGVTGRAVFSSYLLAAGGAVVLALAVHRWHASTVVSSVLGVLVPVALGLAAGLRLFRTRQAPGRTPQLQRQKSTQYAYVLAAAGLALVADQVGGVVAVVILGAALGFWLAVTVRVTIRFFREDPAAA